MSTSEIAANGRGRLPRAGERYRPDPADLAGDLTAPLPGVAGVPLDTAVPAGFAPGASGPLKILRDAGLVIWRNVVTMRRMPDTLVTAMVQPLMFVLLFAYVFAGSLGGASYREFLLAGICVQTVTFHAAFTTVGMANDLHKGIIERFRSLPISRLAVILGRTCSDLVLNALSLAVVSVLGLLVGWRIHGSPLDAVTAYLLLLAFAFALSWVGALIGLVVRSVEVAQAVGLLWLFPLTFVSSAFVSAQNMPGPLRAFAEWNPVTAVADAARKLFGNPIPPSLPQPEGWPAQHAVSYAALCSVLIVVTFMPLAAARYRTVCSR